MMHIDCNLKHNHDCGHTHNHSYADISGQRLFWVILLNITISITEIIGGFLSGSLSLISDALHNFSDAVAVVISYIAILLGKKNNSIKYTFGLKRAEVLAAFLNSSVLMGIIFYLFYQAIKKLIHPESISGNMMLIVAIVGIVGNLLSIFLLKSDSTENMNIRSAYLHMLSDAISSIAVFAGAVSIIFFKIYWIDPFLTILIGLYVLKESFDILKSSVHILMEGTPLEISPEEIKESVEKKFPVNNVHHIHIWAVGEKDLFTEMHIDLSDRMLSEADALRVDIENHLKEKGINHVTIQFEIDCCNDKGLICKNNQ